MTPEEKHMLEQALKLAEDNNALLMKMNRRAQRGYVFQILYWLLIIGLSFGAYYFIQPYVNFLVSALGGGSGASSTTGSTSPQGIQGLLQSLQGK
jgi:hypothetical protein